MSRKIYKPYFSHDLNARVDSKMKNMFFELRKEDPKIAWAAYGLYWSIVEYMHQEDFRVDKLEMYADDLRVDMDFLKSVLHDFDFFQIIDGCYISNRVVRNIQEQEDKSKKASKSASKRDYKKKDDEQVPEMEITSDDVFVGEVIQVYNKEFKKSQIVSNENKLKIADISAKNKLKLEDWQIIFSNAYRGWNFPDGNKKPQLKKILEDWDSFHRGDCYLAPDKEGAKKAQEQKEQQEQEQIEKDKAAVCDKESALKYLDKYASFQMLGYDEKVMSFMEKWDITKEEVYEIKNKTVGGDE
ncbi:MAG: hypothetical protein WCG95_00165 [bacterium]